jgi:hypothetical protein
MRDTTPRSPFVDLVVVIVLDLHDLVARTEGPAEAFDADLARRVQLFLKLDIQGASTEAAPVHRAQHLDVAHWIEPEALRDALPHDRQQLSHRPFRVRRIDEVEVAAVNRSQIGHQALVDAMRVHDDPALNGLAEDLGQAHNRHGTRCDDVGQHSPGPDRSQLIDIADQQQCCLVRQCAQQSPHEWHVHH